MPRSKGKFTLVSIGLTLILITTSCQTKPIQVGPTGTLPLVTTTVSTQTETPGTFPTATFTPTPVDTTLECQETFVHREMTEPYQRYNNQARFTLSEDELNELLAFIGIDSVCIPPEFGAPIVNADWNSLDGTASTGRMLSLGFEGLYKGGGWSTGSIVYATYDFSAGTEYDILATSEDLNALLDNALPDTINIDRVPGFIRYHKSMPMGMQSLLKAYIFPFENHYIAVIINQGHYDPEEIDGVIQEMQGGKIPDEFQGTAQLAAALVSSIKFLPSASEAYVASGFELYLVSGLSDPRVVDKSDLSNIQLVEPPLITEDDILTYDKALHEMALTQEAYSRIKNIFTVPVDVDGLPFVIMVNGETIYSGAFYTYASSLSYDGVTIMQPIKDDSNTISIAYGYPGPDFAEEPDPRSDPRIIERLDQVKKIK